MSNRKAKPLRRIVLSIFAVSVLTMVLFVAFVGSILLLTSDRPNKYVTPDYQTAINNYSGNPFPSVIVKVEGYGTDDPVNSISTLQNGNVQKIYTAPLRCSITVNRIINGKVYFSILGSLPLTNLECEVDQFKDNRFVLALDTGTVERWPLYTRFFDQNWEKDYRGAIDKGNYLFRNEWATYAYHTLKVLKKSGDKYRGILELKGNGEAKESYPLSSSIYNPQNELLYVFAGGNLVSVDLNTLARTNIPNTNGLFNYNNGYNLYRDELILFQDYDNREKTDTISTFIIKGDSGEVVKNKTNAVSYWLTKDSMLVAKFRDETDKNGESKRIVYCVYEEDLNNGTKSIIPYSNWEDTFYSPIESLTSLEDEMMGFRIYSNHGMNFRIKDIIKEEELDLSCME